jgi:hypothetical protein
MTINGCDSVVTLHLTVLTTVAYDTTVVVVGSDEIPYLWYGQEYLTTGEYVHSDSYVSVDCDSAIHVLNLTVLTTGVIDEQEKQLCESELPYSWYDQSLAATGKYVYIEKYAGTEEAYAALEGLEQVYVETNNINDYLAYTKTLNKVNMQTTSQEDSLVYVTAELQYIMGNYKESATGMTTYITSFCPGGRYCVTALYYAANSFYQLRQYDAAQEQYNALAAIEGNQYMEEACMRSAEIAYDKEQYSTAAHYFQQMLRVASSSTMRTTAQLGILRCHQHEGNAEAIIAAATQLLEQEQLSDNIRQEALYYRAKAHLSNEQYGLAVVDLSPISKEVRTPMGAEAKYQLANAYFQLGSIELAEEEVMSFTQMQTTQQYWLAKGLILLSDINVQRGDLFQAKQYLLALQSNYHHQDDIPAIINQKLQEIQALESANEQETTETEEDTTL